MINVYLLSIQEPHTTVAKPIKYFRDVVTNYYEDSNDSSSPSEDYSSDLSEDDYVEDSEDLEYAEEGEGKSLSCGAQYLYIILLIHTHSYMSSFHSWLSTYKARREYTCANVMGISSLEEVQEEEEEGLLP